MRSSSPSVPSSTVYSEPFKQISPDFLELKPLTEDLLPAVVELDHICFGGLWTFDGYQRELASPNSDLFVICMLNSAANNIEWKSQNRSPYPVIGLGCLWAILEEAHITIMAIHPTYQHQGLGQALLYTLFKSAHDRGLERATLEVRESNQAALNLYKKFGFREAGRRRRYYQDTGEDALILWRGDLQTTGFWQVLEDWHQQVTTRLIKAGWSLPLP